MEDSFSHHQKALSAFLNILGGSHHRTGDVHVRIAGHHLRLYQFNEAMYVGLSPPNFATNEGSEHIDSALHIFGRDEWFLPERARALFRKSAIREAMWEVAEAITCRQESLSLYAQVTGKEASEAVTDAEFDDIVTFWSR